jgi:hypothetical protein
MMYPIISLIYQLNTTMINQDIVIIKGDNTIIFSNHFLGLLRPNDDTHAQTLVLYETRIT